MKIACCKAKFLIFFITLEIIFVSFASFIPDLSADAPWPMLGHDERHTGQSQYVGPQTNNIKWTFSTSGSISSSPIIGAGGTIYVCSTNYLFAINSSGILVWKYAISYGTTPAVDKTGTIYVGGSNKLYALNPDGTLKWTYTAGDIITAPTIGSDSTIYFGSYDNKLYAINPTGALKWTYLGGGNVNSPAIGNDGIIYVTSDNGNWGSYYVPDYASIYAIYPTGSLKWRYSLSRYFRYLSPPAVAIDGTIYARGYYDNTGIIDGALISFTKDGAFRWYYWIGKSYSTPAIANDGTIYITSDDMLHVVYPTGTLKWRYQSSAVYSNPTIGFDGATYISQYLSGTGNAISAITSSGLLQWSAVIGEGTDCAIDSEGTLYTGSLSSGKLYAFGLGGPSAKTISGALRYENKVFNETGSGDSNATEFNPIRFAKIEIVRDSDKTVLGTAETKEDGTYNVSVLAYTNDKVFLRCYPQQNIIPNIIVKDGAGNIYSKASVLTTMSGSTATINFDVSINSNEGGAFNIFDCLVEGSDTVKELSGLAPPLITVYWQKGVTADTGYESNTISICLNGALNDPDEYDDAVILHEYGHFIADKYSFDKSLGGLHQRTDTNQDIRLSWSEGWATYFSSMVRNNPLYIDTRTDTFQYNIDTLYDSSWGSLTSLAKGQDTEIAVSSILWDIFDNPISDDDSLGLGAQYIWNVIDNHITTNMDCVLEDFYNGWFSQNGSDFYRTQINNIFSSRSVFYSTSSFIRGSIFTKIDGNAIPDGTGAILNSILNIPNSLNIQNINVFVDLPHKCKSDLLVTLASPSGKEVILHNHTQPLSGQSQDIFAWYQPPYETIPVESLDKFKGDNSQGNWTLKIFDSINQVGIEDYGWLNRWKLEIVSNNPPQVGTITPSSGSTAPDVAKTFTSIYSDPDGWANLKEAYFLVSTSSTGLANSAYLYYDQNANKLYLRNDTNTTWLGGYAPGSSYVIENSQVKLNCGLTTISNTTNTLTATWNITFKPAYSGKKYNTYLKVVDDAASYAGWTWIGTYTVNRSPQVGTITPSSGTGQVNVGQIFTTTYSDPDGWQNIQYAYLLMNTSTSGLNCFYAYYDQNTQKLYLRNDANTSWLGGYYPGSSYVIENSYVKLNCATTSISGSGTTLTVNWSVVIKTPFTGTKNTYLYVTDDVNTYNGWFQKGTWTIPNNSPQVGSITPSSGTSNPNQTVAFTTTYSDSDGWQNIQYAYLLIPSSININYTNCFYGYYDQNTNRLYLRNDDNTRWLWATPGSSYTIENSYVKINCAQTTVSGSGNILTVNWSITFKSPFTGTKNTYLYVSDDAGYSNGWAQKGIWTIINQASSVGTITPSSGTSSPNQTVIFITTCSDPDGWQNIQYAYFSVNATTSDRNCLYAQYDQNTNKLYLRQDGGTILLGGFTPGSNNIIENSYVKINCAQTTVSGSGNTLTINWSITFKSPFTGTKNMYLSVVDDAYVSTDFIQKGTWTIQ